MSAAAFPHPRLRALDAERRAAGLVPFVPDRMWTAWRPLRFYGIEMGTRMTVLRLGDGSLWVHSPIAPEPDLAAELEALGPVRFVVAPSRLHHLYLRSFADRFPGARLYGSPRLPEKRRDLAFDAVLGDEPDPAWGGELDACALRGHPYLDEVVFLDRPSRTLIVADLCEEGSAEWPLGSRVLARIGGIYERHAPPRDVKLLFRLGDRRAAGRSLARILAWDFDRLVLAHGRLIEAGARELLRRAFAFLPGVARP